MATEETQFVLEGGKLAQSDGAQVRAPRQLDGLAVFEDMRCYRDPKTETLYAFRLDDHVKRLVRSMNLAMMDAPCTAKKLSGLILNAVKQSDCAECCVRVTAYRVQPCDAPGGDPLAQIAIACRGIGVSADADAGAQPDSDSAFGSVSDADNDAPSISRSSMQGEHAAQAFISSWRTIPVDSLPSAMRCVAASSVFALAQQEAAAFGASEAVLLNAEGLVCQSTCGNVFVVRDGVLSTPPASSGAYDGVMRDTALNLAMDLDVPAIEEQLTRTDLRIADEAFLADDVRGIVPLICVDGHQVGKGKPGPITEALQKRLAKATTGNLDGYSNWLTEVK